MAPIALGFVVRFSSQDPIHKAENLLKNTGCWLSDRADKSGRIEVEFQLEKSSYINFVDIGNHGSAFVEILAGRSMWPPEQNYHTLVPSAMLMTPSDCKNWNNINKVKMFNDTSLSKSVMSEQWDRIRVVCCQPFNREKPFGLAFIQLRSPEDLSTSPVDTRDYEMDETIPKLKQVSGLNNCIRGLKKIPEGQPVGMSRSARMIQAAVSNRKSHLVSTSSNKNCETSPDHPKDKLNRKRSSWQCEPVSEDCNETKRIKERSRNFSLTGDINDETRCFLEGIELTKIDLDTITYKDLRDQMEKQRECPLTREEKKIFFKLTKEAVSAAMDIREQRNSSQSMKSNNPSQDSLTTPERGCPRSKEALTQSPLQQEYSKSTKNRKGKQQKDSPCYDRSRNRITAMSLDLSFTPPREDSNDDDLLSVSHLLGNTSREKGGTSASQTPVTGTEDCSLLSSPVKPSVSTQDYSLLPSPVKPFDSTQDCSLLPSPVKQSVSTQDCFLLSSPMKPSVSTEDYSLPTSPIKSSVSTQGYSLLPSRVKPSVTVKLVKCPICSSFYQQSFIEEHAAGCVSFAVNSDAADDTLVSCPVCSKNFKPEEIEAHVNFCIDRIEHETTMENSGSEVIEIY